MASPGKTQKPHAICIPFPAQGHINAMLKLAILLHHKGFHITFVHTDYNYNRLLKSRGGSAAAPLSGFHFATIPDGLPPPENEDSTQDIRALCLSTRDNSLVPLNQLIDKLNHRKNPNAPPPVSCVITDMLMGFALDAAERIGVPGVLLQTCNAGDFMCNKNIRHLVEKGFVPFKDKSYFTNGYMETEIDWVPGMIPIRLKDFCNFVIQTTDPNDALLDFVVTGAARSSTAKAIIINTIDALEQNVLSALSTMCPPIYTVGSLHHFLNQIPENKSTLKLVNSSLWREDSACLKWLDSKPQKSVLYVNFGSIAVLSPRQLRELAWGLAGSRKSFVWVVRPDSVKGENAALPPEIWEEIGDRGFVTGWCPQEEVLGHAAVGGFLTHCGWNSMMESVCSGVPMLCLPFFADQNLNCRYACVEWGIGVEIGGDVNREEVGFLVRELMDGERGEKLRRRAVEWKEKAAAAVAGGGSSYLNLERLINEVLTVI